MTFIEVKADLKKTNELLERLTRALELIVLHQYGIYTGHTAEAAVDPRPGEQPTVAYATDEETVKQELTRVAWGFKTAEEPRELENDDWSRA